MRRSSCAQVYFKPGCNVCNPEYIELKGSKAYFPEEYLGKIDAVKIREGCNLIIYQEEDYEGSIVNITGTVEHWSHDIGSYECFCNSEESKPKAKPVRPSYYPALIDMPTTFEGVSSLLSRNHAGHPGLLAAQTSLRNKRSSKNLYILTIGSTGSGKSSAINLLLDNANVTRVTDGFSSKDFQELRIPAPVDELGIGNSELRLIDTPGLGSTDGLNADARFLATLENYLDNHEELHNRIPNVVLIFHKFTDNRFSGNGSSFVKMLRGFDSLRKRLTDPNFSNVIFVFSHFCDEVKGVRIQPTERLARFKNTIENYSQFPKPILIAVGENKGANYDLHMVNESYKLPNGEFYPRNLFEKIQFTTSKGGDPIGEAVFKSAFRESDDFNITSLTHQLVNTEDKRINKYFDILVKGYVEIEDTEVSTLLATSYEEMKISLKRKYPGALYYLQKALSIRNIQNKSDIPNTTKELLALLSSLSLNEAVLYLLEKGLKMKRLKFPLNVVTGYGYNVFKDIPTCNKSPYNLQEVHTSYIGYLFPSVMTFTVANQLQDFFYIKESRGDYIKQRLSTLGIQMELSENEFSGELKPGFNIRSESFIRNSCKVTAVREFRTFSLTLNDKAKLTPEFTELLQTLPVYNATVFGNVRMWNKFFANYGTHVVQKVYGGGAIEIELTSNKACDSNLTQILFQIAQFTEDLIALPSELKSTLTRGEIINQLTFRGGDPSYYATDLTAMTLDDAFTLMQNWKGSLKLNPTILTTEVQLLPMSEVAKNLGFRRISSEIERTTGLLFNSSLEYVHSARVSDNIQCPPQESTLPSDGANSAFKEMIQALTTQAKYSEKRSERLMSKMREDQQACDLRRQTAENELMECRVERNYLRNRGR